MPGTTKTTKKRPAPSQTGPKSKKIHLEKQGKPEKKRSQPITAPIAADAEDLESLEDLDDLESEQGDEWIDQEEGHRGEEDDAMAEDSPQDSGFPKSKDPNGMISSRRIPSIRTT
jgi:pumilio homology domain family member 6